MFECLIDIMDTEETCAFDKLLKNNVPHIAEKIFLHLDFASFKNCLKVSDEWNKLLLTESFQQKAEYVFLEDAMRQKEKLLCGKIKAAQRTQRLKDLLETIIFYMILFILISCYFLTDRYTNREQKEACRKMIKMCSLYLAYLSFNFILSFVMLILCIFRNWSDLTGYQKKWAQEWNNILETEEYKSKVASVFHNDMLGKTKRSEVTKFHKDMLKREEEFRLKEIGKVTVVRVCSFIYFLFIICGMISVELVSYFSGQDFLAKNHLCLNMF